MNKVILMGRLTRDPEIRYGGQNGNMAVARYSLAVDRRFRRDGDPEADFFNLVSFGKTAEFVRDYLHKASKIIIEGELRNNNYTNRNGEKVYSMDITASSVEFAESKAASEQNASAGPSGGEPQRGNGSQIGDGFEPLPEDGELPF